MSVIEKLTEGIRQRTLAHEGEALLAKWEKTGLLEGLRDDNQRNGMARLLENQAAQLLKESSTLGAQDVEGFAAVAFPIVRRVFGGLIAQDLVSVQPMSLPSGLIFFLDFVYSGDRAGVVTGEDRLAAGAKADQSIYGGGRVGSGIRQGIQLTDGANSGADPLKEERGLYNLNTGYSQHTGSAAGILSRIAHGTASATQASEIQMLDTDYGSTAEDFNKLLRFDPDLSGSVVSVFTLLKPTNMSMRNLVTLHHDTVEGSIVRRLTQLDPLSGSESNLLVVLQNTGSAAASLAVFGTITQGASKTITFAKDDVFTTGTGTGAVRADSSGLGLEAERSIPEIDLKIDSVAVTANTRKLKAKWSPELAQDLNAYHNLDAEVELTSVLSEHIGLEIDQEILGDLINGATAGTRYWSRRPGQFVNRETGKDITTSLAPDFTGTVSEWYETLLESINDVSSLIHRKTLRGGANFVVCSPEVAAILEFTSGFRADVAGDSEANSGSWGASRAGTLSRKMDVMVDPYFPRNVVLVGRRGNSFLESGYVYAPYVPLQVTPTIFGTEDFVPRKGVMTRYAKKMVRPDMYGLVVCLHLID
jgi:hypothetical protein|tara:strand:+ start:2883 stop:4649 length:1767 start_codon:yes stop_codon:yes gene_type:complete